MSNLRNELHGLSVQDARRERLAKGIAQLTGLSESAVYGRLRRAHGRSLLRNAFKDVWPTKGHLSLKKVAVSPPKPPAARKRTDERTVHRVRQEYSTSCGVAAVAMFARVSHSAAMQVMFPQPRRVFYTHYTNIRRGLDHFGVSHGGRSHRFKAWEEIPTTSLVKVKWATAGKTYFHWVILQRKPDGAWRVLDPGVHEGTLTLREADVAWYTGVSYMEVAALPPHATPPWR